MQKFFDNVADPQGNVIPRAVVTVKDAVSGSPSTIYSDNIGTAKTNPITCDDQGYFEFYAANGRYTLTVTGGALTTRVVKDVLLEDITGTGADLVGFTPAGTGAVVRSSQDKMRETQVSVTDYGAIGAGDESTAFTRACAAAAALATKRVYIPFASFQVADGTNAQGCEVFGSATTLTGRLVNHAGLQNIVVVGINASDFRMSPRPLQDTAPKILWRSTAAMDFVIAHKKTRGYYIAEFSSGTTTNVGSLAATTTDATRRRMSDCKDVVWAGVSKHTSSATSGVWTEQTMAAGTTFGNLIPANNSSGNPFKYWNANQNANWIEFQTKPRYGRVNVALFSGTTAVLSATIAVNGTTVATIIPRASASSTTKVYGIPCTGFCDDETVTIRVTHTGTNGDALGVIGVHFYELKDWDGQDNDAFGYYRNTAVWVEYLNTGAANDMVFLEDTTGLYGGSFHGGETGITSEWQADGAVVSPSVGGFVVARGLNLRTLCSVTWPSAGTLAMRSLWSFAAGAVSSECDASGSIVAREAYVGMAAVKDSYTDVIYPQPLDLTAFADQSRVSLGRISGVVLRNPTTGQRYRVSTSIQSREENQYGGVHIWRNVGTYNKVYVAQIHGGKRTVTSLHAVAVHEFE